MTTTQSLPDAAGRAPPGVSRAQAERLALDALRADTREAILSLRRAEAEALRQIAVMRAAADRIAQAAGVTAILDATRGLQ